MGMMIDGRWTEEDRRIVDGAFIRESSVFAEPISARVVEALAAETGRFWLIASASCPWSHRTVLTRALKGLADRIPLQLAHGARVEGYPANGGAPWRVPGSETDIVHMHQLYALAAPGYTGRVSVPVLWDSEARAIVSNESSRIVRALDAAASGGSPDFTLAPADRLTAIDELNGWIQAGLSNAVYRAGLAERQEAYDAAVDEVFATLDRLEERLAAQRYLFGAVITETDWRLFATLVRFDSVYHTHFRCTRRRLVDYPALWAYTRDLHSWRGVAETVDHEAIRAGYYLNDGDNNPHGIIGAQPQIDWREPHGRDRLGAAMVALKDGGRRAVDPATLTFV